MTAINEMNVETSTALPGVWYRPTRVLLFSLLMAVLLLFSSRAQAVPLEFTETDDLTPNLAIPDFIGTLDLGANFVQGGIDAPNGSEDDDADAFSFIVPVGFVVDRIELIVTNFRSSLGASVRVRNFSGGTAVQGIDGNVTFANLVTVSGGLTAGTYDLQIVSRRREDSNFDPVGDIALDYRFNFNVVRFMEPQPDPVQVAEPSTLGLGLFGLIALSVFRAFGQRPVAG